MQHLAQSEETASPDGTGESPEEAAAEDTDENTGTEEEAEETADESGASEESTSQEGEESAQDEHPEQEEPPAQEESPAQSDEGAQALSALAARFDALESAFNDRLGTLEAFVESVKEEDAKEKVDLGFQAAEGAREQARKSYLQQRKELIGV